MIERLRFLLDRPLDPSVARAAVVLASAVLAGFAVAIVLGAGGSANSTPPIAPIAAERPRSPAAPGTGASEATPPSRRRPRQDPQDARGTRPARRAAEVLRSHRALQHVPYRHGTLTVRLYGARRSRAVLLVSAPSIAAARAGWRRFLDVYRDSGRSYLPIFRRGAGAADG